ncbi:hypothetical protein [Azospirillum sp. TSO35-2]|uniref:hypothetical protein n=1 Tax=Azospirillum sp. TSO35-2 TaxID=716796 RepID=UPI001FFF0D9D|nr:hypothetical protein [Azospirillum sp. TSO35-2]
MMPAIGGGSPIILLLESVLVLACLVWITTSVLRSVRHVAAVRRRRAQMSRSHRDLVNEIESVRRDQQNEEVTLRQTEDGIAVRLAQIEELQARLDELRLSGPPEYRVLNERFGERDRLWLLTIPQSGRPSRWAVAAPDSATAMALLAKTVAAPERPVVDGHLN